MTIKALETGKSVFVEKPLAMNEAELQEVIAAKAKSDQSVMVGFNRRFAPVSQEIKEVFRNASEPLVVNIRVNAGLIRKSTGYSRKRSAADASSERSVTSLT
ncbi:MAG: Gfo/Idh/MocA family oxidoreductase [Saprospiraceae bacterium]